MCTQTIDRWECGHTMITGLKVCKKDTCTGPKSGGKTTDKKGKCYDCQVRENDEKMGRKAEDPWGKDDPYKKKGEPSEKKNKDKKGKGKAT